MSRKSNVRLIVDGMNLREYLIRCLVSYSYRELVSDDTFKEKTNIHKLGTLTDWAGKRKYKITLEEVYEYGIDNFMISPNMSYEMWLEDTGRLNMSRGKEFRDKLELKNKNKSQKDILKLISNDIGLSFDKDTDICDIKDLILEFMSEDDFNSKYKEYSN